MAEWIVRETAMPLATGQEVVGELVRCKDCRHKYYDGNQIICQKLYWCNGINFEPSADDFCSYCERREEDGHR